MVYHSKALHNQYFYKYMKAQQDFKICTHSGLNSIIIIIVITFP